MTTTAGPRGPYAKSAARREALATAARDVIAEVGHRALTTAEVAKRAGVSERTLFYHFPTRDHLLVAALEVMDADSQAAVRAHYAEQGITEEFDLDEIITFLSQRDAAHPWKVRLAVAISALAQDPNHPAHEYARRHNDSTREAFARLIRLRQRQGKAHPDLDPDRIGRRLVAVWDGLQAQWLVDPSFDLAAEVQDTFRQLSGQNVMEVREAIDAVMGPRTR